MFRDYIFVNLGVLLRMIDFSGLFMVFFVCFDIVVYNFIAWVLVTLNFLFFLDYSNVFLVYVFLDKLCVI